MDLTLALRAALPNDTDLLLELMAGFNQEEAIAFVPELYRTRIEAALAQPQFVKIWLATSDSTAVGYAVLSFTFSFEFGGLQATIDEIYLLPDWRGKGAGTKMLALLEQKAIELDATAIWADVSEQKPGLSHFYERAGFERYPYRPYCKQLIKGS